MSKNIHVDAYTIYGIILGLGDNFIITGEEILYLMAQQSEHRVIYLVILVFFVLLIRFTLLILLFLSEKPILSTFLALLSALGMHFITWALCVEFQVTPIIESILGISPSTSWTDGVIGLGQAMLLGEMVVVNFCMILASCLSLLYGRNLPSSVYKKRK